MKSSRKKSKKRPKKRTPVEVSTPVKEKATPTWYTSKKVFPEMDHFPNRFWIKNAIPAIVLFLLAIAIYLPTVSYDFVLDDNIVLSENRYVKEGISGIGKILTTESFEGYFGSQMNLLVGARYRPLSLSLFAVEYQLFGDSPVVFHLFNVLYYGLLALLIYRVLHLLLPVVSKSEEVSSGKKWYWTIPFVTTLIFVAHPVHVEVVANIKSRDEILCLILCFGSLYSFLRWDAKRSWLWFIIGSICFGLGLLAKETAIAFLAIIPLSFFVFRSFSWRRIGLPLIGILVAFGLYFWMRYSAIGFIQGVSAENVSIMNNPFKEMNGGQKLATISYTLLLYLKLLIFPHPLTHDYYPYQIPIMEWSRPGAIAGLLMYIGLITTAILGSLKKWVTGYSIAFFLASLVIVSNLFFPVGTFMNERFLFMPSVGFCLLLSYALIQGLDRKWNKQKIAWGIALVITIAFIARSVVRMPAWENGETLNTASIRVSTNSARANLFYGSILFTKATESEASNDQKISWLREAESYFDKAQQILPSYTEPVRMKTGVAAELFKFDRDIDQLLNSFYQAVQQLPNVQYVQTYVEFLNDRGQYTSELLNFYYTVGYSYLIERQRMYDLGIKYLNYGIQIAPNDVRIRQALGRTYQKLGDNAKAATYLNN